MLGTSVPVALGLLSLVGGAGRPRVMLCSAPSPGASRGVAGIQPWRASGEPSRAPWRTACPL